MALATLPSPLLFHLLLLLMVLMAWCFGQAQPEGQGAGATRNSWVPTSGATSTWGWLSFDSPYYNLGMPLIVSLCAQTEGFTPAGNQKAECDKLTARRRTIGGGANGTAVNGPLEYPRAPYQKLLTDTGTVFVWLPAKAGHASAGQYVLHSLHNAMGKVGIPSQMYAMTDIPGYMNQYSRPLEVVPDWASLPDDFVVVTGERNEMLQDHRSTILASKGRIAKWHMGYHTAPEHQIDDSAVNICYAHWFIANFLCPGDSVLWGPNPPCIYERALEKDNRKLKRDLVLYDNDFTFDVDHMRRLLPDVDFKRLAGFSREETIQLYRQTKATIDLALPGPEAINAEGSCFDAATIISATGCGSSDPDYNFDRRYKVDPANYTQIAEVVRDVVYNYDQRINDFANYKRESFQVPDLFERDVQLYFHSRGALFYIYAGNLFKMQAVVPLILSIRHLYPLAQIEILSPFDLSEWTQLNQVLMRDLGKHLPFVTFVKMVQEQDLGVAALYVHRPKTTNHHYTVFLDAESLLLGRDLLSLRVEALQKRELAALVFSQPDDLGSVRVDTRVVVANSKTYWPLVHDNGGYDKLRYLPPEELFPALGISVLSPEPLERSELPLPLDAVFINSRQGTMSLAITHTWSVGWEVVRSSKQYEPVKELIALLVTHPLWQLVSAHFPTVYKDLY